MGEAQQDSESAGDIDLRLDREVDDAPQVDTDTAVSAKVFGNSISLRAPFAKATAIDDQAAALQKLAGPGTTIGGTGGPIDDLDDDETPEAKEARKSAQWREAFAVIAEEEQRQREQEKAWLENSHTYAGQTMTGADWKAAAAWFSDANNVAAWEDAMMAETGQTREEVRATGGKMKRFYDLMDKEAKGTLTETEQAEFDRLQADQDVKHGVSVQKEIESGRENAANVSARNDDNHNGFQQTRATARQSINEDEAASGLASVPALSPIYQEAASGNAKRQAAPAAVAPVAANTVKISAENMFG